MIETIHHVQLAMPPGEEERARQFYDGILKVTEQEKPANLKKKGGCWFEVGTLRIHLGVEEGFVPAKKAHPAFQTSEYFAVLERLTSRTRGYYGTAD